MFDYQEVKIVAITQPTIKHETEHEPGQWEGYNLVPIKRNLTPDEFIAYCARVSNPANQNNTETAQKLVNYLIKNEHWSPFEMVSVTMEIKTTRDIGRQILRHRSFSFQEFSQRYAQATGFTSREVRFQDKKNRQNSISLSEEEKRDMTMAIILEEWDARQRALRELAEDSYNWALRTNIAKEQARAILPEGLTMSTMYMAGTLRSWLHYIKLRSANGTQKEHMDIALKARDELLKHFPSCSEYLLGE